jgi:hypothetical protein
VAKPTPVDFHQASKEITVRFVTTRKALAAAATGAVVIAASGVAFAYWSSSGSGTGGGTTAANNDEVNLVVNQTSDASGLTPGGHADLSGTFDNGNDGSVYVASVTASVHAFSVRPNINKPACTQADFSITGTSNTPGVIATGQAKGAWSGLTLNMLDRADTTPGSGNQDNCKGLALSDIVIDYVAHAS